MSRSHRPVLAGAAAALVLAGCGSAAHFRDLPRPAATVDLSVYVDSAHVSVSPDRLGAGPVILYVTNQASRSQDVEIVDGAGTAVASTGSIQAGQTAQVSADLGRGRYRVIAAGGITPASLSITKPRPSADGALLQP